MSKKRNLIIWCIVICMVFPIMSPILAYAEETDAVIKFNDEEHYLSVEPYENDMGLMADAFEIADILNLDINLDYRNQTLTVKHAEIGEVILMQDAEEYLINDIFYSHDPYFYMENGIPMVELEFFCSLFGYSCQNDEQENVITISKTAVTEDEVLFADEYPSDESYEPVLMSVPDSDVLIGNEDHKLSGSITLTTDKEFSDGLDVDLILLSTKDPVYASNYGDSRNPKHNLGTIHLENGETTQFCFDTDEYFDRDRYVGLMYFTYTDGDTQRTLYANSQNELSARYPLKWLSSPKYFLWCRDNVLNFELDLPRVIEGSCGEDCNWELNTDDGSLHIYGNGKITSAPWTDYKYFDLVKSVTIDPDITSICNDAFQHCINLESVSMPDSVTYIGEKAFAYCTSLTDITLSNNIKSIRDDMFLLCSALETIYIPDGVTSLSKKAFNYCNNLSAINVSPQNTVYSSDDGVVLNKSMSELIFCPVNKQGKYTVPESVVTIAPSAFVNCKNLTDISMSDNVTSIGEYAFKSCASLTDITIPDTVTSIGEGAFYNCAAFEKIVLPSGIETIAINTFALCTSLTDITIPDSVKKIKYGAFQHCESLVNINIPDNVSTIDGYAFSYCTSLTDITLPRWVSTLESSTFYNCTALRSVTMEDVRTIKVDAFYNCTALTDVKLFKYLQTIGRYAFYNCTSLENIDLPERVTTIDESAFRNCTDLKTITLPESIETVDSSAFINCTALTEINIAPLNKNYVSDNGVLLSKDRSTLVCYPFGKGNSYTVPDTVTMIDHDVFNGCINLTGIDLPQNLTTIGHDAFNGCINLTGIDLPQSLTTIGHDAFNGCTNLTEITLPQNLTTIDYQAFYGCEGLTEIIIPQSVTTINRGALSCTGISSIILPENLTKIDNSLFSGCTSLVSVSIPAGVKTIGTYAFSHCTSIRSLSIPDSVTYIDYYAFSGCSKLEDISLGNSVESIQVYAFEDCSSLADITLPDSLKFIATGLFKNCVSLTDIVIPESVKHIYNYPFLDCVNLKNVTLPKNLEIIESEIFSGCDALESIELPNTLQFVSSRAFDYFYGLKDVYFDGTEEQFNKISYIKSQRLFFKYATKHFKTFKTSTAYVKNDDGRITLNITLPDMDIPQTAKVYAIGMDGSRLSTMTGKSASSDESLTLSADKVKKVKVFIWDENMKPLTTAEEIEIQ